MVQTLTDIKAMLAGRGIHPRKRFGQNFLIDARKLDQIIAASAAGAGDLVLEVGPGTGVLTERLLEAGAAVVACEIDRDMCAILSERLGRHERFSLIEGDVMAGKHELAGPVATRLAALAPPGGRGFLLVANLPYNIASPLLATLALDWPAMRRAVVMVQREVGDRIASPPGTKAYGPLSVVMQLAFEVQRVTTLSPGCFWPQPQIDSVVLRCDRRDRPLADDPHVVSGLAHRLFQQRRKQIGSILGRDRPLPAGVDAGARPEQLAVEQFVRLAESLDR